MRTVFNPPAAELYLKFVKVFGSSESLDALHCLLVWFGFDRLAFVYLRTTEAGLDKSNSQWIALCL